MAREKSNVDNGFGNCPWKYKIEFAERGLCTLISSEQCIPLLVTNGLSGAELLPRWLSGWLWLLSHSPAC